VSKTCQYFSILTSFQYTAIYTLNQQHKYHLLSLVLQVKKMLNSLTLPERVTAAATKTDAPEVMYLAQLLPKILRVNPRPAAASPPAMTYCFQLQPVVKLLRESQIYP
jgi:anaerobic C4-dicarboxylate transporter